MEGKLKEFDFDPKEYYTSIKDLLRYESELADRRLKFLLTLQTCLVGGHIYVERVDLETDLLSMYIPVLGLLVSLTMFQILRKGLKASNRIAQNWKRVVGQYQEGSFPPVWGVKGYGEGKGGVFEKIFGVSPEYYVLIPLVFVIGWLLVLFSFID